MGEQPLLVGSLGNAGTQQRKAAGRNFACVMGKEPSGQHSPARPLPPHWACLPGNGRTDLHWGPGPGPGSAPRCGQRTTSTCVGLVIKSSQQPQGEDRCSPWYLRRAPGHRGAGISPWPHRGLASSISTSQYLTSLFWMCFNTIEISVYTAMYVCVCAVAKSCLTLRPHGL